MMSCRGIAPKYMYQEESLHPECALDYSITKDEGMLDNVYINENGEGYIDGFVAMIGGQGSNFEGRAEVSSSGSIAKTVVVNAGDSYTSGQMKIFYSVPSAAAPQVEQPLIRSDKVMTGTISRVFDYPFLDLMSTPHSVLVGCESGHVEVDSSSGGNGFRAEYSVKKFGHMFEKLCIGVLDHQTGACDPRLDNHGANYTSRPRVRLVETSIQVVRIKSGPGASIRGCNVTNATLQAHGGGLQSRGFRATYSVLGGGSIDEIKIESAGRGYETEPSIYPTDPACMCGSGIGEVSIVSAGSGYRGTYSNDTAGFFVVGPNSRPNPGAGFKAIFGTAVSGQLMNIRIVDAGDGYAGDEVELVACPVACCALFDETCCLAISSGASCKNGILEAEVRAEVGFRGGVAGKNFDRCLEPVIDRSSCRCGSGVAEIQVVDAGSGYINGVLAVSESLPSACYDPCLVALSANDTKSRNATNTTNSINHWCNSQCAIDCVTRSEDNQTIYAWCMYACYSGMLSFDDFTSTLLIFLQRDQSNGRDRYDIQQPTSGRMPSMEASALLQHFWRRFCGHFSCASCARKRHRTSKIEWPDIWCKNCDHGSRLQQLSPEHSDFVSRSCPM
jgi:hypothetical protein